MIRRSKRTAKRLRAEKKVIDLVYPAVVNRDGYCRASLLGALCPCSGPPEWAHFGDKKRFKTRGQKPEERHTTAGSLMLCRFHHREYDQHRLRIEAKTEKGCDGALFFSHGYLTAIETRWWTNPFGDATFTNPL